MKIEKVHLNLIEKCLPNCDGTPAGGLVFEVIVDGVVASLQVP